MTDNSDRSRRWASAAAVGSLPTWSHVLVVSETTQISHTHSRQAWDGLVTYTSTLRRASRWPSLARSVRRKTARGVVVSDDVDSDQLGKSVFQKDIALKLRLKFVSRLCSLPLVIFVSYSSTTLDLIAVFWASRGETNVQDFACGV